jgi:hypothetical protein
MKAALIIIPMIYVTAQILCVMRVLKWCNGFSCQLLVHFVCIVLIYLSCILIKA